MLMHSNVNLSLRLTSCRLQLMAPSQTLVDYMEYLGFALAPRVNIKIFKVGPTCTQYHVVITDRFWLTFDACRPRHEDSWSSVTLGRPSYFALFYHSTSPAHSSAIHSIVCLPDKNCVCDTNEFLGLIFDFKKNLFSISTLNTWKTDVWRR